MKMVGKIGLLMAAVALGGCAVTPAKLGMSKAEWQALSANQREQYVKGYQQVRAERNKERKVYAGPNLSIYLERGKAKMPPFDKWYSFQTINFSMQPGHCRWVRLASIDTNHHVDMRVCYNGLTLGLDASPYDVKKANGTVLIDYNPIWQRGFTYSGLTSTGLVQFKRTNVTIKALNKPQGLNNDNSLGY